MSIPAKAPTQLAMAGMQEPPKRYGRVRADALPEYTQYRDDGCEVHPHCLSCPLPRCRYEEPGGLRALLNERRDREIVEQRLRGASVEELADRFGVSRRTVFRVLESYRQARRRSSNVVRLPQREREPEQGKESHCA